MLYIYTTAVSAVGIAILYQFFKTMKIKKITTMINGVEFIYDQHIVLSDTLHSFDALKIWTKNLTSKDGIKLNDGNVGQVEIRDVIHFGKNIGFLLMNAHATWKGSMIPSIGFMRNDCVAVLPLFHNQNGIVCTALVKQIRVAVGKYTIEMPAGICDGDFTPSEI